MTDVPSTIETVSKHVPWNKGKIVGAKPPLRAKHVRSFRTKLQVEGRTRDMALFNVAVDSKLRACDIVALKVDDVAQSGYAADRASVRQKKTGRPVKFELTESTPQAIDDYLRASGKKPGERLFTGPQETRVQPNYSAVRAAIVRLAGRYMVRSSPVRDAFTASNKGAPHLPAHRQLAAAQLLLGHTKIESTVRYLGIEVDDALATSRRLNLVGRADMLCPSFTSGLGT